MAPRSEPRRLWFKIYLLVLCVGLLVLVGPATVLGVEDPRLAWYFDNDEGILLERLLAFRSGALESQFAKTLFYDYGPLFKVVAVPMARLLTFPFEESYRTIWVGVRCFNLLCGLGALTVFWILIVRHFRSVWLASACVTALAVTPEFVSWLDHLKPEPFQLLLVALCLLFTLELLRRPQPGVAAAASLFAAAAFATKYIGVFLLPGIVFAWCAGDHLQGGRSRISECMRRSARSVQIGGYLLSIGALLAYVAFAVLLFVNRRGSTGRTWVEEFGPRALWVRWEFLTGESAVLLLAVSGLVLAWVYRRSFPQSTSAIWLRFAGLRFAQVVLFFAAASMIFGYQWLLRPVQFLEDLRWRILVMYGGSTSLSTFSDAHPVGSRWDWIGLAGAGNALGFGGLALAGLYVLAEPAFQLLGRRGDQSSLFRRLSLMLFVASYAFVLWALVSRRAAWYLLPIVPLVFLVGLDVVRSEILPRLRSDRLRHVAIFAIVVLVGADALHRGALAYEWRMNRMRKPTDVGYEVGEWLTRRYPADVWIVTDDRSLTYVPSVFEKVVYLHEGGDEAPIRLPVPDSQPAVWIFNTTSGMQVSPYEKIVDVFRNSADVRHVRRFEGVHQQRNIVIPWRLDVFEAVKR